MFGVLALGLVERLFNGWIDLDAGTRHAFNQLAGKTLRLTIASPNLTVDVCFDAGKVYLEPTALGGGGGRTLSVFEQRPYDDVAVKTANATLKLNTIVELFSLMSRSLVEGGNIPMSGDIKLLQQLQQAIALSEPDIGEKIAPIFGNEIAEIAHQAILKIKQTAQHSSKSLVRNGTEWLKEDTGLLAKQYQFAQFKQRMQQLQLSLDRLEAQVNAPRQTPHASDSAQSALQPRHDEQPIMLRFSQS